mgnify:CR=1 FL=1
MSKTLIRHITKDFWLPSILRDGVIRKEGSNFGTASAKQQFRMIGRFVWFTEIGYQSMDVRPVSFEFFAEDIKAIRWTHIVRSLKKKLSRTYAQALNQSAIDIGDDPEKWWVRKHSVSISKATRIVDASGQEIHFDR